ncbi:MAG: sodium:calcium antiporter [Magnetococcales bacterium]|nr:sodium:calcium antiporter [Magnetococcales bacterium]
MVVTFVLLIASAVTIYLACELFVNGVEWLGRKMGLGETATGTILAAFGTALPESVVTLVAVAFGDGPGQKDIGVGAALAGPMVLSTLTYGIVGLALMANASQRGLTGRTIMVDVDHTRLSRDQAWFMAIFIFKVALGFVAFTIKPWLGILFLAAYGLYVMKEVSGEQGGEEELEPLKFRPQESNPAMGWVSLQTGIALVVIFAASHLFVAQVEAVGIWFGVAPQVIALILSPIATELPETMNALIWVRQGRERLALANVSGAMMIQATVPSAFGLFFTPWLFDRSLTVSAAVTMLAIGTLFWMFHRGHVSGWRLSLLSLFYLIFVGSLVF